MKALVDEWILTEREALPNDIKEEFGDKFLQQSECAISFSWAILCMPVLQSVVAEKSSPFPRSSMTTNDYKWETHCGCGDRKQFKRHDFLQIAQFGKISWKCFVYRHWQPPGVDWHVCWRYIACDRCLCSRPVRQVASCWLLPWRSHFPSHVIDFLVHNRLTKSINNLNWQIFILVF